MSVLRLLRPVLPAAALLAFASPLQAQPASPASTVAPAVQALRRAMLNPEVNTLTFRSMDQIFTTRTVARGGPVRPLIYAERPLDFTYEFQGARYTPEQFLERTYTNALLVMKDGKVVSEIYRNGSTDKSRFMAWSMTKSLTSLLVGVAVSEGRIKSIDQPVVDYLPELKGGAYNGVSIRQVLQMRSGVDYEERYDFANPGIAARNHEGALVTNTVRFADAARTITRKHPPGAVFEYKTLDTAVLGWLLERVSGGSNVASYMAQRLWEPLGAEADGFFIMDGPPGVGREFTGAGFNATLRDYARVGQLVLNQGKVGDRQVVPAAWIAESTSPAAAEGPMGGYGYQWWTIPGSDAFNAIGLQGQFIYVDPPTRTVVVKLSYFPPGDETPSGESQAFFKAVSGWTPR